jgi:hypothetical protein
LLVYVTLLWYKARYINIKLFYSLFNVRLSSADDTGCRYILPGPDNVAYVCVFLGSIIICRLD